MNRRKFCTTLVLALLALLLSNCGGEVGGVLEVEGNIRAWRFEPEKVALVTEITERDDGLINWDRYVICPNGERSDWTFAVGYSLQDFEARFMVQAAKLVSRDSIYYTNDKGGEFLRPTGCD